MTKAEFVRTLSKTTGATIAETEKFYSAFIESLTETLIKEKVFKIPDFGVFRVVTRKTRKGRNPRTGKEIKIPATPSLRFKVSKVLQAKLK